MGSIRVDFSEEAPVRVILTSKGEFSGYLDYTWGSAKLAESEKVGSASEAWRALEGYLQKLDLPVEKLTRRSYHSEGPIGRFELLPASERAPPPQGVRLVEALLISGTRRVEVLRVVRDFHDKKDPRLSSVSTLKSLPGMAWVTGATAILILVGVLYLGWKRGIRRDLGS